MAKTAGMKNNKIYIAVPSDNVDAPDAQDGDLTQAQFEALTWTQVQFVGEIGEYGNNTEMASYETLDQAVVDKIKTITNPGDPVVECRQVINDNGQIAMKVAGGANYTSAVAIKREFDDMPAGGTAPTTHYFRAKVGGPLYSNGRVADFTLLRYTLGITGQEIIEVVAS